MKNADILLVNGLSKEMLASLSYETKLGRSLKNNLHYFNRDKLLQELFDYADWLNEQEALSGIAIDYRIKSDDSIELKYNRYYPDSQARKVFNDILGFRAFCDDYAGLFNIESEIFKLVDMSRGKAKDDGYRGIHLYYQMDNFHYPIEIQFNTLYDRQMNNWLHDNLYKRGYPNEAGRILRCLYEEGKIRTEYEFVAKMKEVLENVLHNS